MQSSRRIPVLKSSFRWEKERSKAKAAGAAREERRWEKAAASHLFYFDSMLGSRKRTQLANSTKRPCTLYPVPCSLLFMSLFLQFAELNDALVTTTKKLEKRAFIADYLRTLPVEDAGRAALCLSGTPFAETDRRVLNIGGALLSKAVADLSGATQQAMSAAYRRHGDFGAAAADLLRHPKPGHAPTTATLTLAD